MVDRERELAGTRWLVYDRHLHVDLRAHDRDAHLRERIIASGMHLFAIQEIATGADARSDPRTRAASCDRSNGSGSPRKRSISNSGHWTMRSLRHSPTPSPTDAAVVFSGGDSGRDYATLFEAIRGLPVQLRLCAGTYPTPVPPNVTVLPRLALHQFRDEVARATVVVVPLTGQPPVSGITVIAMAKMMGKPVIASDNPVVRMHIPSHGDGGYLTPIGDAASLRALLTQLIESPAERERLGREARAQAAGQLSLKAFVDRLLAWAMPVRRPESPTDAFEPLPVATTRPAARFSIAAAMRLRDARRQRSPPRSPIRASGYANASTRSVRKARAARSTSSSGSRPIARWPRRFVGSCRSPRRACRHSWTGRRRARTWSSCGRRASGHSTSRCTAATAGTHDARTGQPGSWRRALALLITAPQLLERVRVGVHFMLSAESADELAGVLQVVRRMRGSRAAPLGCRIRRHGRRRAGAARGPAGARFRSDDCAAARGADSPGRIRAHARGCGAGESRAPAF